MNLLIILTFVFRILFVTFLLGSLKRCSKTIGDNVRLNVVGKLGSNLDPENFSKHTKE